MGKSFEYMTRWIPEVALMMGIVLLLSACRKDSKPDRLFDVFLKDRSDHSATIGWTDMTKVSGLHCHYELYLNETLVAADIENKTYTFQQLKGKTTYQCRLVARAGTESLDEARLAFTTFENYPPAEFEIVTDSITGTAVSLHWEQSTDPENRPLSYALFVNNQLVTAQLTGKYYRLQDLSPQHTYTIRVVATDDQQQTTPAACVIKTLKNPVALMVQKQMAWDGLKRSYAVYRPNPSGNTMPLLIYFHGAGGHAWPEMQSARFKDVADENNFLLVYPQASIWDQPDIPSWNINDFNPVDDLGFIREMLKQLIHDYPIDEKRVYITGMSSGGYMTYYLAFKMGEKFAAIAPVSGLPVEYTVHNETIGCELPLLHMHGTLDATVSYHGGYQSLSVDSAISCFVRNNHCNPVPEVSQLPDINTTDGSTITVYNYTGPYTHKDVVLYKINGGGHGWPGASNDSGANKDIVAENEIWNFFRKYALN